MPTLNAAAAVTSHIRLALSEGVCAGSRGVLDEISGRLADLK